MLVLGACLLVAILTAHDARAVWEILLKVRFGALAVVAAHLPVTVAAAFGWRCLLPRDQRPGAGLAIRLRFIKEAVNAILPVAQVGGDVVRARLATSSRLSLSTAAASCMLDAALGLACLALFVCLGLAATSMMAVDHRAQRFALQLAGALVGLVTALVIGERLGLIGLVDRALSRSAAALGSLAGLGEDLHALAASRRRLAVSAFWHLLSWGFGAVETWVALSAIGIQATFAEAFVLESLIQGVRAAGFVVPGALGLQEGGYLLICTTLGIQADQAVALSLLRRMRELTLGAAGLALWRFQGRDAS